MTLRRPDVQFLIDETCDLRKEMSRRLAGLRNHQNDIARYDRRNKDVSARLARQRATITKLRDQLDRIAVELRAIRDDIPSRKDDRDAQEAPTPEA